MIKECCVCGKREREGRWSRQFLDKGHDRVSHGYCPACFEEFMNRIDQHFLSSGTAKKFTAMAAVLR